MTGFTVERALLAPEIKHLEHVAMAVLTTEGATNLLEKHDIRVHVGSLYPYISGMEAVIKACDACQGHEYDFTVTWPEYVRSYLGTNGWELGYGFVGSCQSGEKVAI
jgi:hypothetical protein